MSEAITESPSIETVREAFEQEFGRFAPFVTLFNLQRGGISKEQIEALGRVPEAEDLLRAFADLQTRHTGKKSALAALKKQIGRVAPEDRAQFAQGVQQLEADITGRIEAVEQALSEAAARGRIERERLDVTLPGRRTAQGHLHPITLLRERIDDVFVSLGYAIEDGAEIETDFYNFEALNIPDGHPARSPQDTFYTTKGLALRSQTSTMQIHAMQRRGMPLRVAASGRVFRRDTPDATHNPMFFQVECLCVDKGITMGDLKGTVEEFVRRMFGAQTRTRVRASYFPFTEPSAEFDYSCFVCGGAGCRVCKHSGWIELGGSGMVHPNVLEAVGISSEEYSGFAFGFGIDRMCALMYGIDDIRLLFENDRRFLEQFS